MAETADLMTAAKIAQAWGVPKGRVDKLVKEQHLQPDAVKAGCSYYSLSRLAKLRPQAG